MSPIAGMRCCRACIRTRNERPAPGFSISPWAGTPYDNRAQPPVGEARPHAHRDTAVERAWARSRRGDSPAQLLSRIRRDRISARRLRVLIEQTRAAFNSMKREGVEAAAAGVVKLIAARLRPRSHLTERKEGRYQATTRRPRAVGAVDAAAQSRGGQSLQSQGLWKFAARGQCPRAPCGRQRGFRVAQQPRVIDVDPGAGASVNADVGAAGAEARGDRGQGQRDDEGDPPEAVRQHERTTQGQLARPSAISLGRQVRAVGDKPFGALADLRLPIHDD